MKSVEIEPKTKSPKKSAKKIITVFLLFVCILLVLIFFAARIPVWFIKFLISTKGKTYCWFRMKIYAIGIWKLLTGGANSLCTKSCDL